MEDIAFIHIIARRGEDTSANWVEDSINGEMGVI